MRKVLCGERTINIPDIDGNFGNGMILISDEKYYEYQYKLREFMRIADEIYALAISQNLYIR